MDTTQLHFQNEVLDKAPVWILAADRNSGKLHGANQIAREELGLHQAELNNINDRVLWALAADREELIQLQEKCGQATAEVELVKPNGSRIRAVVSCQADPACDSNVLWWITGQSAQSSSQHEPLRNPEMLAQVLELLPIAAFIKDVNNDLRYVLNNRKFREMWGLPEPGNLGQNDAAGNRPEVANMLRQQDLEIIRSGQPFIGTEQALELPDGSHSYISTRKVLVRDSGGNPNLIVGVTENVTDRVVAEKALKDSEKRFRELVSSSPVGIFLTDESGSWIYANEQWQKTTGMAVPLATGLGWMEAIHPEDRERVRNHWMDFPEQYPFASDSQQFRYLRPDGQVTWVSSKVVAFRNDDGQTVGYVGSDTDITRHKQFEEELQASRDEATRANAAKSEFLSRMSHELRTPLNAVLGFGQLLQMDGENLTGKQVEWVADIVLAGTQLLQMIENVLDFTRDVTKR